MGYSFFKQTAEVPADVIFELAAAFAADPRAHKVNLGIGIYQDENLQTPVLKTVKSAEQYLLNHEMTKTYLPIGGDPLFIQECGRLVFGSEYQGRICGMQVPGGTAGLRIGADFVRQEVGDQVAIPDPTWPNHLGVFKQSGFKIHAFSYYDVTNHRLDGRAIFKMLETVPARSAVLFHACCHNPTGADLSLEEWDRVADVMKKRELFPFFDFAYQGFGKGIEEDAQGIRLFVNKGLECVVVSSCSKNFGLYSERVGALFVVADSESAARRVLSNLKIFARTSYSNPPRHGAAIVGHILSNEQLKQEWIQEVDGMRHRLDTLRKELVHALERDFSYLLNNVGMFCYLGLEEEKVRRLREEYGIYMAKHGRMNLAGLSRHNFKYVTEAMRAVL